MSQEIINTISAEIATHKRQLNEEWTKTSPSYNADESDNRIKNLREKIKKLKAIRDELETIFYGKGEEKNDHHSFNADTIPASATTRT